MAFKFEDIGDLSYVKYISLEVSRGVSHKYIEAKQGDDKTRFLAILLTQNNNPLTISENITARFRATKSDKKCVLNDCLIHNGLVYVELTDQTLAVEGTVKCDIGLYQGEKILSSATFFIDVATRPFDEKRLISSDEFLSLEKIVDDVKKIAKDAKSAIILKSEINENGELIITYSDHSTVNVGKLNVSSQSDIELLDSEPTAEDRGMSNTLYVLHKKDTVEKYIYAVRKNKGMLAGLPIWDGTKSTTLTLGGEGTQENPYKIYNGAELYRAVFGEGNGKYYELCNDIVLNDLEKIDWETGEPIGDYVPNTWTELTGIKSGFEGYFNGNGHSVYGLYYKCDDSEIITDEYWSDTTKQKWRGCALFPYAKSITDIKNLGMDYTYIRTPVAAGAVLAVSKSDNIYVDNCYVGENVNINALFSSAFSSYGDGNINITNCYSLATYNTWVDENFTGTQGKKGFTGSWWTLASVYGGPTYLNISNCYDANGYIRYKSKTYGTNNYMPKITVVDGVEVFDNSYMKGTDVLTNSAKMPDLGEAYIADKGYPALKAFRGSWVLINKVDQGYNPESENAQSGVAVSQALLLKEDRPKSLDYLKYTVENQEVTITYCDPQLSDKFIVIPDLIQGYPVTSIGIDAFRDCESLINVDIPDSVTSIGDRAFYNCSNLTSITLPNGVSRIGYNTFYSCCSLVSIILPYSITKIEISAFIDCDSLSTVYYEGTEIEKENIDNNSDILDSATWHYNYSFNNVYTKVENLETELNNKVSKKQFEYINTVTVAPDEEGNLPTNIIFSADSDGNAFELTDFYIYMYAGFTDSASTLYMAVNDISVLANANTSFKTTALRGCSARLRSREDGYIEVSADASNGTAKVWNPQMGSVKNVSIPPLDRNIPWIMPVTKIDLYTLLGTERTFIEGSTFELYGVRK